MIEWGYLLSILRRISSCRCHLSCHSLFCPRRLPRAILLRGGALVAVPSAPDESCRRHGGLPMRLPRPSAAQPLRLLVGIAGAKIALKSAAVQPFHECTGVKVTTRPANHCCSERVRAPRQPAKTKKSSQSTQPQECNHATRQRREQHLRSHSQKKWTPSAAPTPTARRRSPAKVREST